MGRPKRLYPLGKYRLRIRGPIDTSKAYLVELEYTWNRQIVRKGMNIFVKVGDWNEKLNKEKINRVSYAENTYSELWKGFFENISIEERESYQRQRQHLPIRFRGNMVEFVQ